MLFFLNLYCTAMSHRLFYQTKEIAMREKAQMVASAVAEQNVLNPDTARDAMADVDKQNITRLVITDISGQCVYDSLTEVDATGSYCLFPEIVEALEGNDVFTWRYHDGAMESQAASPILRYNNFIGCVYIMEYDTSQGMLIQSLLSNILSATLVLTAVLLVFNLHTNWYIYTEEQPVVNLNWIMGILLDMASLQIMMELVISAIRVKRLRKKMKK